MNFVFVRNVLLLGKKKEGKKRNPNLSVFSPSYISTVILLCFCSYVQRASEQEMVKAADLPNQF